MAAISMTKILNELVTFVHIHLFFPLDLKGMM